MGALKNLGDAIARACGGPAADFPQSVIAALKEAVRAPAALPEAFGAASDQSYTRHLIYEDPAKRFSILSLVWEPSQITSVHGHNYWCAYAVLTGAITETCFTYDAVAEIAHPVSTTRHPSGFACFHGAGLDPVHQLSNADKAQAISLHVYGTDAVHAMSQVNHRVKSETILSQQT